MFILSSELMTKRAFNAFNINKNIDKIFISVRKNELYGTFGVGILSTSNKSILNEKIWCLRFNERNDLALHQLCSLIYVHQKCNLQKKLIFMDPIINFEKSIRSEEMVPYINTIYSYKNKMEILKSMYYQYSICDRLAYFASDISNTQGVNETITLFGGKRINVKFLFNE